MYIEILSDGHKQDAVPVGPLLARVDLYVAKNIVLGAETTPIYPVALNSFILVLFSHFFVSKAGIREVIKSLLLIYSIRKIAKQN